MSHPHQRRIAAAGAVLAACLLGAGGARGMETGLVLRVGAYENRPKIYTAPDGRVTGFFPALLEAVAREEGWRLTYVHGAWQDILSQLERGEIDLLPDVALTPERQRLYAFNEETVLISWGAIYTRPDVQVASFADLADRRIAVLRGSVYSDGTASIRQMLDQFGIGATYLEVKSYRDVFQALSDGRADAGVVNNIFGSYLEREFKVAQTPVLFSPIQLRFALPARSELARRVIPLLDARLRAFKDDPQSPYYRALDAHLFGTPRDMAVMSEDLRTVLSPAEREWIRRHPEIRLGIDPEFYPFVFREADGRFSGMGADYVGLLNERLGLRMKATEPMSWAATMEAMRRGEVDVLPCVGLTQARGAYALFTKPMLEYQRVILTRTDLPFLSGPDDLASLRVGVQVDTSHEGYLRDEMVLPFRTFPSLEKTLLALSAGEVDAVVGNLASAAYWIRRLNLTNLKVAAPVGDTYQLHFAVRKDWPELVAILDKGLDLLAPEDKQAIANRWIAVQVQRGIDPRVAWRVAVRVSSVVVVVVLAILLWTYRLKREIARRRVIEEQLGFRVGFERLASETSSRFVAADPAEIDRFINVTLAEIVAFTNATAGFLCVFDDAGRPVRTHAGGEVKRLDAVALHPPTDPPDSPWLARLRANQAVVAYARPPREQDGWPALTEAPPWLAGGSLVEVPCGTDHRAGGFLGLLDLDGTAARWRTEDLSLLRLVSEMLADALRRKETEEAMERYARDLEAANRRLQDLDRLKSLFIASVSHELRTPLNSIIGFTGVLLKGLAGPLNPKQQDQMARVNQSAQHLLALISDIIDISKIEAGHVDVHPQEFLLADVVREALESIRPQAQAKGLALEADVPPDLRVRTDRKRVRQCILNYLSNAVKYTESGRVRLEARDDGDRFEVSVHDTGIGISAEDQQRLFAPFVRLDSRLRIPAGGTGLGLHLTRKVVVELLQGAISVRSEPERGSTFAFQAPKELPKAPMPGKEAEHAARADH